jgi:hypothetical protein
MSGYPESLPGQLYLLAYDPRKERLTARTQLGYLMRAAALTELRLRGHIADEGRKVRVTNPGGVADPVLGAVLREVADSRPGPGPVGCGGATGAPGWPSATSSPPAAGSGSSRVACSASFHKRRIAELSDRTGPAVPALRRVIQQARSSAAGG